MMIVIVERAGGEIVQLNCNFEGAGTHKPGHEHLDRELATEFMVLGRDVDLEGPPHIFELNSAIMIDFSVEQRAQ